MRLSKDICFQGFLSKEAFAIRFVRRHYVTTDYETYNLVVVPGSSEVHAPFSRLSFTLVRH